jgi:hypothetical protein
MNPETISPPQPVLADVAETVTGAARASLFSRVLLAIAVLFVLARALPFLSFPIYRDQATYLVVGGGLLQGKQLYRDLWDNKPPGIFILYAGIAKLFGRVTWSVGVLDILLLLIISYLLFRFTEPFLGRSGAAIGVMVHASMCGEVRYFWIGQPETFQVVCVLAGYFLMARRGRWCRASSLVAGLFFGYAFLLKYNAVAFIPFFLILPFLDTSGLDREPPRLSFSISWRSWLTKAAFLVAGFVGVVGVVLAWIVLKGAWPAMKEVQFEVLPRYAAMAIERDRPYWLAAIIRTKNDLGVWNLWATVAGLVMAWMRRDLKRFAPVFLALLVAFIAAVMQIRFHDYYFQTCYPFLAAIWAYLAVSIFEGARALAKKFRQRGWRLACGLVWIVFANVIFWPLPDEFNKLTMRYEELREWRADPVAFYSNYPRQLNTEHLQGVFEVIYYLQKNARPGDGVYAWSLNCLIYYLTGHQPPTRFVSSLPIMSLWSPPSWRAELMRDLVKSQPRFIVVARGDQIPFVTYVYLDSEEYLKTFPEFDSFITNYYEHVADFDGFVIYRHG